MIHYLSSSQFAARIGVQPDTLNKYKLPEPDVMVGHVRGWTTETVDRWNGNRPGRGSRRNKINEWLYQRGVAVKGVHL